jgi:hypothetical protein
MVLAKWVCVLAVAGVTWPAVACSPVPDNRPYVERLAAEKVAFVGTVTDVSGRRVTFEVEHVFAGSALGKTTIQAAEPSTCAITFPVGKRWIYAGNLNVGPSVLLQAKAAGSLGAEGGRLKREPDEKLSVPAAWQACKSNSECVIVPAGCNYTAANTANAASLAKKAIAVVGDHRAMSCATRRDVVELGSQCVSSKCGSWLVDYTVRP